MSHTVEPPTPISSLLRVLNLLTSSSWRVSHNVSIPCDFFLKMVYKIKQREIHLSELNIGPRHLCPHLTL
ncbi:hypothetical protein FKM82_011233 [Ascaphus truei]